MVWWQVLSICIIVLLVGFVAGFIVAGKLFKSQLKKKPPINEKMIRAMFSQMGRTPSEKQVRAVMRSMEEQK